jgi:hypothetical protein
MTGPEILERSPLEILIDDRGRNVRRPADRRGISELLCHAAHHRCDRALLVVSLRPDAEPTQIDQTQCNRGNAFAIQLVLVEVLRPSSPADRAAFPRTE